MPVHFNSFIPDKEENLKNKLLSDIVSQYVNDYSSIIASENKKILHITNLFKNQKKKDVGKVVITLLVGEQNIEIIDVDITLIPKNKALIHFDEKLDKSSDANEYYQVYDLEEERHFDVETVNRSAIQGEIIGKDIEVYLSAFPFQLDVYKDEDELNKSFGMPKEVDIPSIGKKVITMYPRMMSVGSAMSGTTEPCSFIIGEVISIDDVTVDIANNKLNFKIINLETGVGIIPVAVNDENFDLSKLKKGALIGMLADIKADFIK